MWVKCMITTNITKKLVTDKNTISKRTKRDVAFVVYIMTLFFLAI